MMMANGIKTNKQINKQIIIITVKITSYIEYQLKSDML